MIGFDEAQALLAGVDLPLDREIVPLEAAAGRVLAAPVVAAVDAPPRDVSAMDGYAVRDGDLPGRLPVAATSWPGQEGAPLAPGTSVRIFTGAPVPAGADRVVIQEEVTCEGDEALLGPPGGSVHIRRRGADFCRGDVLLPAGRRLDPRALVAAAGADLAEVEVYRRPRVVVLGTGDELAAPGTARSTPGAIPESISIGVAALAESYGADVIGRRRLADDLPSLERAAADALEAADLVIVTGGASVGERDRGKAMFAPAGLELIFSKVAIKPGKPVWLGRARGRIVLGLPGNPSSALVTARLFLAPLLGHKLRWRRARLTNELPAGDGRETFHRAVADGDGVRLLAYQDSGAQKILAEAELLIRRAAHAPAAVAGEEVQIIEL